MADEPFKLIANVRSDYRTISWSPEEGLRAIDNGNESVEVTLKEVVAEMQMLAHAAECMEAIVRKVSCLMKK